MEMFLMALCLSLLGVALTSIAFAAATRPSREAEETRHEVKPVVEPAPARFFAESIEAPASAQSAVSMEALLLQIERHVRLEQAAAESFLEYPTAAALHSRTTSPLVH